jgi:hypothetical protein
MDAVGLACGMSGALGFSPLPSLQHGNLDEVLSAVGEPAQRSFAPDPARLARALEGRILPINNLSLPHPRPFLLMLRLHGGRAAHANQPA